MVAVLLPGIAAHTGQNFHLAARLRSVAHLNRKSAPSKTIGREQNSRTGVRRSVVRPPAVLSRKPRKKSGQVIQLATRRAKGTLIKLRSAA